MSAPVKSSASGTELRVLSPSEIAQDLFWVGLITTLILVPIVYIRTLLLQSSLTYITRPYLTLVLLGVVLAYRLVMRLLVWNPRAAASVAPVDNTVPAPSVVSGPSVGERIGPYVARSLLLFALILPVLFVVFGNKESYLPGWDKRGIDLAIGMLIYIMLGWGLNVVVGLAGLLDLGYVAFYAVGAYSYALLSTVYFPLWFGTGVVPFAFYLALPVAGLLAATWGIILGFPVLRLRGDYLAIVTLAFGEIIRLVLINWSSFTNGPQGIQVPKLTFFGIPFVDEKGGFADFISTHFFTLPFDRIHSYIFLYYVILALALVTYFVTRKLRRLPIGRAWEALREDEIACRSLGINTTNTKLTAFAIGAMFGGFAGSFFAARQGFVTPESFVYIESAMILAIVVLGGLGSQIGIVFSVIAIMGSFEVFREMNFLKQVLPSGTEPIQFRMLAVGVAMVLMMRFRPRGFVTKREPTAYLKESKAVSGDLVSEGHG